MASTTLRPIAFKPSAPVRSDEGFRNTVIEDTPQVSLRRAPPQRLQPWPAVTSPLSDDFPTPRANTSVPAAPILETSPDPSNTDSSESDQSSLWSKRSSKSFDELYDVSESDSEEVPIKLSSSVKKRVYGKQTKNRYPSLVIPSPSQWPTIEKLQSATALSPPLKVNLSPSILARLQERSLRVPSTSSTPSLDGSQTSEELARSSCPSTPEILDPVESDLAWEPPVQLNPSVENLLQHLHPDDGNNSQETVIEIPEEAVHEMREIVESPPVTGQFKIKTPEPAPNDSESEDELSALSVPSPGGFFASLDSTMARQNWSGFEPALTTSTATEFYGVPFRSPPKQIPTTSTATTFYDLPWRDRPKDPVEHVLSVKIPTKSTDPVTARKVAFSPIEVIFEVDEIDDTYDDALKQSAAANLNRTQLWLSAQNAYMQALCEEDEVISSFGDIADATPKTPDQASPPSDETSPGKKSVRFAEDESPIVKPESSPEEEKRISPIHDGTFWEAWRHQKRSQRARDVFRHRQARAEAEHVKRLSLQKQHAEQLNGKYEIKDTERPAPQRPVSSFLPSAPEDERKELIALADRERQALEQLRSSSWHLAAQKEVNGGKLLTSPIVQSFKTRRDVRVLDLAGQVHCSWAWTVASDHPDASIYTTVSSDAEAHVASLEGPSNHFVVTSPKLWELPFGMDYFDVVSARNLYFHLRTTWPKGFAVDEWELTLRECLRVLKPGGYLEFDLLDAELVHPDELGQALGVEFAFNLKTRGYDPSSGKNFLPRLKRAGFHEIKRAWMVLPVADAVPRWSDSGKTGNNAQTTERLIAADGTVTEFSAPLTGSTKDVRAMTGLVGARMWEQWMLKLSMEMGRSEKKVLDDVVKALEEGGKGNASWRCLVGWARKDL
ncbi:hypothetical protein M409DRAFT_17146 [Zasmidium cellare ATCC 36951]|uniref:Methyltransferase type 11 domain-containing protein n=1 Tax=Zasmidium cellare ATCC 36951 TaxID=1080233 RepID=A0A6A6D1F6_ZASCE|nr:uncharacterized protein M409DRAFT_17146 [Zasmidium cellare ATCC 36951]KAF2173201.1 hypothetical protein M409DRAFT_17146 [Zasmidium cellare ATCC 36951]